MIDTLDHLVLTVRDIDATVRFYESALGMKSARFSPPAGARSAPAPRQR
jgi:catechol 2,3-dioxygenase-like lactoylglutathione lyase family enzyme